VIIHGKRGLLERLEYEAVAANHSLTAAALTIVDRMNHISPVFKE